MLKVDLGQLDREGSIAAEASISADDGLWEETDLSWVDAVKVSLRATLAGTGEVVARGNVNGALLQECRRCMRPVKTGFSDELTLVFVSGAAENSDGGGAYLYEPNGVELDMSSAVREELVLAINPYVVCKPECLGLCPQCGIDLNDEACSCTTGEADPRWAALRDPKDE